MRAALLVAGMLLMVVLGPGAALASRVALVIGNSDYRHAAALPNPVNDAADVAAALQRLGFAVTRTANLGSEDLRRALIAFGRQSRGAEIALVFFAGHGMEIGGENWLIPVDAELRSDSDAENEAVSLRSVMLQVTHASKLGLVILDACRNNPFAAKMQRSTRVRAVERGFVRIEPTDNVLVAYAAREGTTANDGDGRNSPFTSALLRHLETAGLEIRFLFATVRDDVMAATRREQQPFVYGSLSREQIYLKTAPAAAAAAPVSGEAERAWAVTQHTTSVAVLEEFIRRFGDSFYAALARARLEELKKAQVAVVAPPVPPAAGATPAVGVYPGPAPGVTPPSVEGALRPKDAFKDCDVCPEMVVVPQGSFTMGSPAGEKGRDSDEGPQFQVMLARQFAVGRFAVTFDEWDACVAGGGCNGYRPADQGWGRGRRPVINVSWNDAKAYVAWLARKTGKAYRLLSEAEREYVARAGTTTPFWWGASIFPSQANYNGYYTYDNGGRGEHRGRTVPVDSFQPNPFGLYQVHGNVWEWTEDCWNDSYRGPPTDGSAWTAGECHRRVIRGGSWFDDPRILRSAARSRSLTDDRRSVGFRLARTLDAPGAVAQPGAQVDPPAQAWAVTQHTTSIAVLEEFIRRFGDSSHATLARARLEELKRSQVAAVAPPVPLAVPPGTGAAPAVGVYPEAPKPVPGATPLPVERERALRPKDAFKECDVCPEMVVVPHGSFTMGSHRSEKHRDSDEGPEQRVTFARRFAVGRFAVTFDEWDACVAGGGCNGYRPADQGWGRGRRPVINVSWNDAKAYVAWLARKTGRTYRLLSEAEREYVARAGTRTPYWSGDSISTSEANFDGNYSDDKEEFRERTVPVDSFQPNPFGLYQVHGNVWEWTEDCWNDSYRSAPTDGSAWTRGNCNLRALRGGSWYDYPWLLRAADRFKDASVNRLNRYGFRLARTLAP